MILYDLSGTWQAAAEGVSFQAELPGTLDQNGFGPPDDVRRQWKLEDVKKIVAGKCPVEVIDMRDYGMIRGEKVLDKALKLVG